MKLKGRLELFRFRWKHLSVFPRGLLVAGGIWLYMAMHLLVVTRMNPPIAPFVITLITVGLSLSVLSYFKLLPEITTINRDCNIELNVIRRQYGFKEKFH